LMFANRPPLGLFQTQTFGGVYSDESLISNLRLSTAPRPQATGG
jgi:hypothetical protein